MYYVSLMFEEFRHVGQLLAAGLILTLPSIKRRPKFALRSILGAVFLFAFTFLFLLVRHWTRAVRNPPFTFTAHLLWYSIIVLLFVVYMAFCFKLNPSELFWLIILVYAVQHLVYVIINELVFMWLAVELSKIFPLYVLICIVSTAVFYFLFFKFFIPNIKGREHFTLEDSKRTRIIYLMLLILFVAMTFVNQHLARTAEGGLNYLSVFSDMFNCVLALVVQYSSLRASRLYLEKTEALRMYNISAKQYENFKKSVDYINIKCHDIKHQLRKLQNEGQLSPEKLEELNDSVAIYETFVSTGNKALDMVLTDRHLTCRSHKIAFSYMADAERLSALDPSDIYAMFSNMLDNAIEHVKDIEDEQKRYIRLSIKPIGKMLHIHQENYMEGNLEFTDGLPQTTKPDKIYHGFGVKSIKNITELYGGKIKIDVTKGVYRIDILLPLNS